MSIFIKQKNKVIDLAIFFGVVVIPWLLIVFYVTVLAQSRYISTSNVVVKQLSGSQTAAAGGLAALFGANNVSTEDANYLIKYIHSNDMINKLDEKFNFRQSYYVNGSDVFYEIDQDATQEELLSYFTDRVHVTLDDQSHILTLKTEAFQPEVAVELNKAILGESEQFINRISRNIARDQVQFAANQVQESYTRLTKAKENLLTYQNNNQVFDPQLNAQMVNQLIGSLQSQLSSLRTEERQLLSYLNPDAPQIGSIRSQIAAVEKQIKEEQDKLTSPNTAKLNLQAAQFDNIKSEVEFATELYKVSISSLEQARLEALRKMKNLIVVSAPYQAEQALYPKKAYVISISLVLLLMLYAFVRLGIAIIKEHN